MTRLSQHISCADQSVSAKKINQYDITIRLLPDGFSFVVFDTQIKKYVVLEEQSTGDNAWGELLQHLETLKWTLTAFHEVRVIIDNQITALIPLPLYNAELNKSYLSFLNDLPTTGLHYQSDKLTNAGTQIVYAFSNGLLEQITHVRTDIKINHAASVLIDTLALECKNKTNASQLFLNVKDNNFDMLAFNNGKLLFFNNFKYSTAEDFLYFVLFGMEQQHLNPETVPTFFMGNIETDSTIVKLCETYIRDIRFVSRNKNFKYAYLLEELPFHYHYLLYNSLQCEL